MAQCEFIYGKCGSGSYFALEEPMASRKDVTSARMFCLLLGLSALASEAVCAERSACALAQLASLLVTPTLSTQ